MKKLLYLTIFLPFLSFSQNAKSMDSLISIGVKSYDQQNYELAIECYQKALKIDSKSELANYELALTYMALKDYENGLKFSEIVIDLNEKNVMAAYLVKGSCLDELGKTDESIKLFEKGIKKFGYDHLLCYNLGMDYYRMGELAKAQEILEHGIDTKNSHASSHMLLAYVLADQGMKVRSILALHYFLLLEPSSKRSEKAYALLLKQMGGNVKREEGAENKINIYVNPNADPEFSDAELMLSLLSVNGTLEENKSKSSEELFIENTTSMFKMLGELKKKKDKGLYWEFYIPLFDELAHSNVIDAYCYYISQQSNEVANKWMEDNQAHFQELVEWFKKKG
ncbi:MAG: hypothetical protein RIS20_2050 [Bacteroidota bacterium]|jgi:Tfp pilus assembly protein PilF